MLIAILTLLLLILIILLALIWLLLGSKISGGSPSGPPGPPTPTIPDTLSEGDVATLLAPRLAGTPADGSAPSATAPTSVVWVDQGDAVLVHLDSVAVRYVGETLLVSMDLECDQTGRTALVVPFALGATSAAGATLVAATEEFPRGNALLAARWGQPVRNAAWSALLQLASDHATERSAAPMGLTLEAGQLHLTAGPALTLA
jgi:hypothetical protein